MLSFCLRLAFEGPGFWVVDHADDGSQDFVVGLVEARCFVPVQVAKLDSKFKSHLRFGRFALGVGKFADECLFVSSLAPCFGDIRANRSR